MKINGTFVLRAIAGDHVLIPVGETAISFNGMIALNGSGAYIWELLSENKTEEEIVAALLERYDVSEEAARSDYLDFTAAMVQADILIP